MDVTNKKKKQNDANFVANALGQFCHSTPLREYDTSVPVFFLFLMPCRLCIDEYALVFFAY